MRILQYIALVLVLATPAFTKPVGTSIERLEELKAKLRGLEKELSNYDVKDTLDDLFPDVRANDESQRQLASADRVDSDLNAFLATLPEAERHLLEKRPTKLGLLREALAAPEKAKEPGPIDIANVPAQGSIIETRGVIDDTLQEYLAGLSPEDRETVNKVKSKLHHLASSLKDVLSTDPLDVEKPDVYLSRRGIDDDVLQEFLNKLSQDDQTIVNKLKSKLKYLMAALTDLKSPDPLDVESKAPMRRGFALPPALIRSLSSNDQQLVLRHPSKLHLLEQAMRDSGSNARRVLEAESTSDTELEDFIKSLSDVEAGIVQKYHTHLDQLRQAVHEKKHENPEDQPGKVVPKNVETNAEGQWGSRPADDSELGLIQWKRCKNGECEARAPTRKRCKNGECEGRAPTRKRCENGECEARAPTWKRCANGECEKRAPTLKELARRIAAELRASKGDSVTLADVLKRVKETRLNWKRR